MEQTQTALEQRLVILRQAFASDAMSAFRPMATSEVMRVLRGVVSNAKGRAEKQSITTFDHKALTARIEGLAKLTELDPIQAEVALIEAACDEVPKQEAGAALLPLTDAELAELESIHAAMQAFAEVTGQTMATLCSTVRRALLTWRQEPKDEQDGQDGGQDEQDGQDDAQGG